MRGLRDLGWFDTGRSHKPLRFLAEPLEWDEPITANSMVISTKRRSTEFVEVGSGLSTDTVTMAIDLYTDTDTMANHLANDIRDLLRGRLGIGPVNQSIPILNLGMATPVAIGNAQIGAVSVVRIAPIANRPHLLHWQTVFVDLTDSYYDSSESP